MMFYVVIRRHLDSSGSIGVSDMRDINQQRASASAALSAALNRRARPASRRAPNNT